jgi:membrane fusion protein (multidrug efflux system)
MSTPADTASPQPHPARRSRGRTLLQWMVPTAIVLGVAAWGLHWWSVGRFHEETEDAYVGGEVTVMSAKIAGYISELPVSDNQFVHAGDLLARIDTRDYNAALQRAAGSVDAQQAALVNIKAGLSLQQSLIAKARAGVDAAQAEETRACDDAQRHQDLVKRSAVSLEAAQRAQAAYQSALAGTARARADLQATERQLDVIAAQRLQAAAALEQAKAEQQIAQLNVGYTEIRAPRDGYIGNRKARIGSFVSPGNALLALVPAQGLWVDANFKEDQLRRMQIGQRVSLRADAWPGQELHGRVASLAPATGTQFSVLPAENATGNFTKIVQRVPVRIELDTADSQFGRLRPGLSVVADVDTASAPQAPQAPKTALQ